MPQTALTSALNATILTGNGNEGLLQNDMGNTLIKDSITGNVMSLNDGFIPLGMKEHGGILYIASYNPSTKEGELGTIPSPIIHYNDYQVSNEEGDIAVADMQPTMDNPKLDPKLNTNLIYISDHLFHCGDKFIVALNLNGIKNEYIRQHLNGEDEVYPIISKPGQKGWYKINLYAITDSGKEVSLDGVTSKVLECYNTEGVKLENQYWFLDLSCLKNGEEIDEERTRQTNSFKTYPNIPSGRLAIRFEPELHEQLLYLDNTTYDAKLPALYFDNDKKCVLINGFTYEADCAILPDKIVVRCNNGNNEGLKLVVEYPNGKTEENSELTFYINNNIDNNSGLYLIKQFDSQHQSISRYYLTRNETEFSTKNYDSTCFGNKLFYIKIDNLNTDIYITVDLYVYANDTDTNKNYVYYRTDHLPKYNPALASADNDVILAWKQLYYEFGHEDNETYDVELFNKADEENSQRCFLYDDTGLILEYNKNLKKYQYRNEYHPEGALYKEIEEGDNPIHTVDHYMWLRTWIYPLTVMRLDDSDHVERNSDEPDFIWNVDLSKTHRLDHSCFVKCAAKPIIRGRYGTEDVAQGDEIERNILLPLASEVGSTLNQDDFLQYVEDQKSFFEKNWRNEAGLLPGDMSKYCLYAVNLNTLYSLQEGTSDLLTDPDGWNYEVWVMGNYGNSYGKEYKYGTENFFNWASNGIGYPTNRKPTEPQTDYGLVLSRTGDNDDWFHISTEGLETLLGVDINYMPWKLKPSIGYFDDTGNCDYYEILDTNLIERGTYFSFKYSSGLNYPSYGFTPGFVNTSLSLCPGYFGNHIDLGTSEINKPFEINLKLLNYIHSSKYLYSNSIQISLENFGLDFLKVSHLLYYGVFGLYDTANNLSATTCNIKVNVMEQLNKTEPNSYTLFVPSGVLCRNIKLSNNKNTKSILELNKICKILPEDFEYTYKFNLTENPNNSKEIGESQYQLVVAPQIFGYVPEGELTRSYKADFEIATLIDLKDGNYKGVLVAPTVLDTNYLIDNYLPDEVEYITDVIGERNLSSQEIDNFPKNSFDGNAAGYFKLNISDQKILEDKSISLDRGYYVFCVNHNADTDNIKLKLNISGLSKDFTDPYFILFSVAESGSYNFNLTGWLLNTNDSSYIKNIGVYKVNTSLSNIAESDQLLDENIEGLKFIENTDGVIFDSVLCYHEVNSDNNTLGCLDKEFIGFKSIPDHSYQRCVGYYKYTANEDDLSLPKVTDDIVDDPFKSKLGKEGINILRLSEL